MSPDGRTSKPGTICTIFLVDGGAAGGGLGGIEMEWGSKSSV